MATYITLMRWTGQGIAKVKDSPKRLDAGRKAFKKMGVEIKDTWLTMGKYDLVCVLEGPDDAVAKALLHSAPRAMCKPKQCVPGTRMNTAR